MSFCDDYRKFNSKKKLETFLENDTVTQHTSLVVYIGSVVKLKFRLHFVEKRVDDCGKIRFGTTIVLNVISLSNDKSTCVRRHVLF